ncbi:MAG: hypothetical protein QF830_05835 [Rhodospirillales bacterium]|jgi:UDP-N-acetylmuramyl tripeptide synthase|nr:hypothetical protein [Rhodospirillales bacterium]MDP6883635.1 hypothetical protein [Rhodospirillales bacterium]
MTRHLVSDENPTGYKLEDILKEIRKDAITRCTKIVDDQRTEAQRVLENNMKILNLLSKAINLAEDSTRILDKSFGPSQSAEGGPHRIGET